MNEVDERMPDVGELLDWLSALPPELRAPMVVVARALVPYPKAMAAVLQEVRVADKPTPAERMLAAALRELPKAREDAMAAKAAKETDR